MSGEVRGMRPRLEEWLKVAGNAVEVHHDDHIVGRGQPFEWHVWVSNGAKDPREWQGTMIARCRTETDAELVAEGLRVLKERG